VSAQRKYFPEREGLTLLTGAPPPTAGGGQAAEVYRLPRERPTTTSGSYRVKNSAIQHLRARRSFEERAVKPQPISLMSIVSLGLILMSVVVAFLALAMV